MSALSQVRWLRVSSRDTVEDVARWRAELGVEGAEFEELEVLRDWVSEYRVCTYLVTEDVPVFPLLQADLDRALLAIDTVLEKRVAGVLECLGDDVTKVLLRAVADQARGKKLVPASFGAWFATLTPLARLAASMRRGTAKYRTWHDAERWREEITETEANLVLERIKQDFVASRVPAVPEPVWVGPAQMRLFGGGA